MRIPRPRALVPAVLVAALLAAGVMLNSDATPQPHHTSTNSQCTPSAIKQLPQSVVDTVDTAQMQNKIPTLPDSQDVLTRNLDQDMQAFAFVMFVPKYCGYVANINDRPISDVGRRGLDKAPLSEYLKDNVIILKDGVPYNESTTGTICVSNTQPVVLMNNGGILMILLCDRAYPSDTWMQAAPVLR